ncbi:ATP phosphoribosyltransferase regulatory subunit [Neptuniibacter caesariensis]|uniref:ATP phosphoribosyltransferase regulatory subunit n=1 Tax=Neptuniibacter caesariensis TaxID=207954 RepID=A0A7U8C5Q2_NEPCE|nr:ATP phosphoribosyltransferase regulatory subunit [Neptuniibacter caesariensis]EAR60366.1 ATP phosphoribosyltransferase regulatory subunit [Neptuniibacter caesariensis]
MALADRWLLPEGVQELLPPQARRVELLRRRLLDLYQHWGYEQVMPPVLEHLESLLTGVGRDLDLNTVKVTDQISGHTLGVRADITPQVARIDAHRLRESGATRLCYCGSVVHALPAQPLASRNPLQLGAELFGHSGIESDVEVISLMVETMHAAGVKQDLSIDLGHVGVFTGLMEVAQLTVAEKDRYLDILNRKALPELSDFVASLQVEESVKSSLAALPTLNGGAEVLVKARELFADAPAQVLEAIDYLEQLAQRIALRFPELDQYFDLSELRGYNYHTGIVFAAYTPAFGQAIAKGGRYDEIGRDFGRARPATGFSADLKTLVELSSDVLQTAQQVLAPAEEDSALLAKVSQLRSEGVRVIYALPGAEPASECTAELVLRDGEWVVIDL